MILEINSHITIELLGFKNGIATFKYVGREDKSIKSIKATQFWKIGNSCSPENLQKIKEIWPEEFI